MDYVELVDSIRTALVSFRSGWYLGCTALCYIIIQLMKGKAGFDIPLITPWVESLSKGRKTGFILGLFSLAGLIAVFGSPDWKVMDLVDGALKGLALGLGAIGTHTAVKQGSDAAKPQ